MEITFDILAGILDAYAYEVVFVDRHHIVQRADQGEDEMFETLNQKTGEREFFVPVRVKGQVIGYFERHEAHWDHEHPEVSVVQYWKNRI